MTPVAMTLGRRPAGAQQGAIDGAVAAWGSSRTCTFSDAAKYVTDDRPAGDLRHRGVNKKWYDSLPPDLQQIIDKDAAEEAVAISPSRGRNRARTSEAWTDSGGELINLPPDEQAAMMKTLASVGEDVSKTDPALDAAYKIVTEAAAAGTRQARAS